MNAVLVAPQVTGVQALLGCLFQAYRSQLRHQSLETWPLRASQKVGAAYSGKAPRPRL